MLRTPALCRGGWIVYLMTSGVSGVSLVQSSPARSCSSRPLHTT